MPETSEYSTEAEWMAACVPVAMDEGLDNEQAVGKCMGMWNQKKEDSEFVLDLELLKSAKAGRRHSDNDHRHLTQAIEEILAAGGDHPKMRQDPLYTKEVVEMKALVDNEDTIILTGVPWGAIKAAGDMTLEVLGIPFGGPDRGKDSQGQYFSPRTKTYLDAGKSVPVFYYHGYTDGGKPQGDPVLIGTAKFERTDDKGHWFRVALDKTKDLARKVWEAAKKGLAKASSGAVSHLVRLAKDGEILNWVIGELSVFDTYNGKEPANAYAVALPVMKSLYQGAGIEFTLPVLPDDDSIGNDKGAEKPVVSAKSLPATDQKESLPGGKKEMDEKDIETKVAEALAQFEARQVAKAEAAVKAKADFDAAVAAEVATKVKAMEDEAAKSRRLPGGGYEPPHVAKFAYASPYDNIGAADLAVVIGVMDSAKHLPGHDRPSENAYRTLALKMSDEKTEVAEWGKRAMKAAGIDAAKSDEINYSTLSSYGDEWAGIAYSQALWELIRINTPVLGKLPQHEFKPGAESEYLPLESTDPTWYKVAQASSSATSYAGPTPTVTATLMGTGRVQMTLAKLGARVVWTEEMNEDSLISWAPELRRKLGVSGAEYLESALIDGDTETTASTNINDIDGTPTATDWFLVWDGFRKSPLVTTTANSRSAAASLDVSDYLETVKLMGTGGKNGFDRSKTSFIVDISTNYKTVMLPELLTKDVYSQPTIEGGVLSKIFGYEVLTSAQMCKNGGNGLSEATGKCDETSSDNTYGQILAVRWDQWQFGWRRRLTMESMRWPASDSTEIVAMLRCGLIQRDTESAAISYNVGV